MSDAAIRVAGLGKLYRLGKRDRYRTLRETLVETFTAPFRLLRSGLSPDGEPETLWALRNVSFEVGHGEVIGIIGRNGAGKSTLLKILSRITEPTEGSAEIHGRVGSLLEVGTGFHPELTGRENIFLNGAILGMKRSEILRKFDEIVAFAELEKFIDTPVKHFSSGMYMRLAFAVAAHLEPEILMVDEVLAVGDAEFQKKCLGKMGEVARQGRTVMFVSHNLTAVATLCQKAVWLNHGNVVSLGPTTGVIAEYLRPDHGAASFDAALFPNEDDFQLLAAQVRQGDNSVGPFVTSAPLDVKLRYTLKRPVAGLRVGIDVMTVDGITLWRSFDDDMCAGEQEVRVPGTYSSVCRLPENLFFPRQYVISLSIGIQATRWITFGTLQQTVEFYNLNGVGSRYADERYRAGLLMLGLEWKTTTIEEPTYSASL